MNLMTQIFHDFGQREHLFAILGTPFLILGWERSRTGMVGNGVLFLAAAGFFAGMGAALKPYFIAIVLAGELVILLRFRNRSIWICPEILGFVCFGAIYAMFFICSTQIRTNYLELLAPLISKGNSAYYAPSIAIWNSFNPFKNKHSAFMFLALLIFFMNVAWFVYFSVKQKKSCSGSGYLLAMAVMAFISYLYQSKGWYYHLIPFEFLVAYLFIFNVCSLMEVFPENSMFRRLFAKIGLLVILLVQLTLSVVFVWRMEDQGRYWNARFFKILKETPVKNDRVLFVSSTLTAYPFLVQADKRPGSRFLWFFPIALLYSQSHDPNLSETEIFANGPIDKTLETRFIKELISDIQANRPAMIFINTGETDPGLPKKFSLENYLKYQKVNAVIEKYYRLDSQKLETNNGTIYDLWVLENS
jgi:hypothetical protein